MNPKDSKKASRKDWHPEDVKAALRKKGITLMRLAKLNNVKDSSSFSACLVRPMRANEQRIADALGLHPKEIWPSRYNEDGSRKPQGIHALQCTAPHSVRNVNRADSGHSHEGANHEALCAA